MLIKLVDLHACFCSVEKEFKVQTCVIPIDFGSQDVYPKISSAIEGLEIGILGKFIYWYPAKVRKAMKQVCDAFRCSFSTVQSTEHIDFI